jgi:putative endonuclease
MDDFVVYILFSEKCNRFYVGYTSSLIKRFHSHNSLATKGYTVRCRPWEVVYVAFFESKDEARKKESALKSYKSSKKLLEIITTHNIQESDT